MTVGPLITACFQFKVLQDNWIDLTEKRRKAATKSKNFFTGKKLQIFSTITSLLWGSAVIFVGISGYTSHDVPCDDTVVKNNRYCEQTNGSWNIMTE